MTDCVLYARVSTKEQQDEGYSLDAQRKALARFCDSHGLTPVASFEEAESASKPGRREFAEMVTYFASHPNVRTLVACKLDRVARNWNDSLALQNLGVRIRLVEGDVGEGPEGRLNADIQQSFANFYSLNLSREVKKGMHEKAVQGGWGHRAPLGYLNENKAIVPDPASADHVAFAFERYSTGLVSLVDLANEVYARGLRTKGGNKVGKSTLHHALTNPIYCGLIRENGELHQGQHSPLVSARLFEQVQAAFEPNRNGNKQHKHEFLLRGFLTCADCGCKITAQETKGHVYYRCTHGKGKDACGQRGTVREERLVPQVADVLRKIALKPHHVSALLRHAEELDSDLVGESLRQQEALRLQIAEVERKASLLADKLLDGTVSDTVYREKAKALTDEGNAFKLRLSALQTTPIETTPLVKALTDAAAGASITFENASPEVAREVLALTLSNLSLSHGEIVSYQWKRPFEVLELDSKGALCEEWWAIEDLNL
ncbi:MAG: recombinase family protein [Coriobacteriia bacterium]|nr:recombinase family protein [Coriobacteriia bacterium]